MAYESARVRKAKEAQSKMSKKQSSGVLGKVTREKNRMLKEINYSPSGKTKKK